MRPSKGAELAPEPSPLLTEPRPASISQAAVEIESEVLEGGSQSIQWLLRDVRQQALVDAAQPDLLAQKLQLSIASQAQQPLATDVDKASLAPASLEPKPKRRGRPPAAEQAAALMLKAAAAPKPRRCSRQPAAEQAPAVKAPAGPKGVASVVKAARRKPAKPRAMPKAGAAAPAEPAAGLLMLQQEPLVEQQVRSCTLLVLHMLQHMSYSRTAAGHAL